MLFHFCTTLQPFFFFSYLNLVFTIFFFFFTKYNIKSFNNFLTIFCCCIYVLCSYYWDALKKWNVLNISWKTINHRSETGLDRIDCPAVFKNELVWICKIYFKLAHPSVYIPWLAGRAAAVSWLLGSCSRARSGGSINRCTELVEASFPNCLPNTQIHWSLQVVIQRFCSQRFLQHVDFF